MGRIARVYYYLEMLVEFIKNEGHAMHETVHIGGFAVGIAGVGIRCKSSLESLEILHPIESKVMLFDISLVEDEDEGKFCFVEDTIAEALSVRDAEHNDRR